MRDTHRYTLPAAGRLAREVAAAALWGAGALGIRELDGELVAWFEARSAAVPAGGEWAVEPAQDWLAACRLGFEPVAVGGLIIAASWHELPAGLPPAPRAIVLDPGMAFGTGHHATTRFCIELLSRLDLDGARVLDLGTGSGILAIAACRLGAGSVVAVDLDVNAVATARANAARNRVRVDVRHGGPEAARERAPYDVAVANLTSATLIGIAAHVTGLVSPGGVLVASGIGLERSDEVATALTAAGLAVEAQLNDGEWVALRCARSRPAAGGDEAAPTT